LSIIKLITHQWYKTKKEKKNFRQKLFDVLFNARECTSLVVSTISCFALCLFAPETQEKEKFFVVDPPHDVSQWKVYSLSHKTKRNKQQIIIKK